MKNNLSLTALAALTMFAATAIPALADEARHEEHQARREAARAADSRVDAAVDRAEGHPIRAELEASHARHEERRAVRHADDAAARRW